MIDSARTDQFTLKYGFAPPPLWACLSDYDLLLDVIVRHRLYTLDGDIVEIGAFMGGGTYKLSMLFSRFAPDKTIFAVDNFGASQDLTPCSTTNTSMSDIYREKLDGSTQRSLYEQVTALCSNLKTVTEDSAVAKINSSRLCFSYIDGCHSSWYVKNDFRLVWPKIVSGGIIAFDDYGFDLPTVTSTIDEIVTVNRHEIADSWCEGTKTLLICRK